MATDLKLDYGEFRTEGGYPVCAHMIGRTLDLIANKWAVPIILTLALAQHRNGGQPLRFSDLARAIPLITQKELTKQLRAMETAGLVGRKVYAAVPPKVEYWLTDLGASLKPVLQALARWSAEKQPELAKHLKRNAPDTFAALTARAAQSAAE